MNIYDKTTKLCIMGMLSALSIVLVFLVRIPILPEAPYLEYDPADIPILISSYLYGPISGLAVTLIVCILQGITFSSGSGIIGIIMHFFASANSFVLHFFGFLDFVPVSIMRCRPVVLFFS